MFIQEIILEGFKSYASRTVISGWDSEFNAITGLNGSGKSNILDAICFVLGIENLRQVRATTLQDLVYKRGQAGITKASVTIVFNNEDASRSPVGFAEHKQITVTRQVVVGGKNKYLVNGHNAQAKLVENLFQSIQLNINNPHFLIMQGQITKVLNMKPPEILAMLEETAGTRMFEDRRVKALSTMEKKERKVEEIGGLLGDVIGPKLDALRAERTDFLEYKRAEVEIERLAKFLAAFDYHSHGTACEGQLKALEESKADLAGLEDEVKAQRLELDDVEDKIMVLTKKRELDVQQAHKLKALEDNLRTSESEMTCCQAQVELTQQNVTEEEKDLAALKVRHQTDVKSLDKKRTALAKALDALNQKEASYSALKGRLDQDKELLQSLSTGISSSGGHGSGYERLIEEIQQRLSGAQVKIQQAELRITTINEAIGEMKEDVAKARKEGQSGMKKIETLRVEVEALKKEREGLQVDLTAERDLETRCKALEARLRQVNDGLDQTKGAIFSTSFNFADPSPNFDRSRVKGTVAQLVSIPEDNLRFANALEISAGGRLYNVVVEDEGVANALLERGKLTRRVTIIPLNKIIARPVADDKVRLAGQLTEGRAQLGLSLVTCEEDVLAAIQYVFGSAFVCEDKEAAALVAFDKRLGHKAVTLEGDVYEPSGTLSGGSAPSSGSLLTSLCQARALQAERDNLRQELEGLRATLEATRSVRRQAAELEQRLDLKSHELQLLERQSSQKASGKLLSQYEAFLNELAHLNEEIAGALRAKDSDEKELARVLQEKAEFSSNRDGKLGQLEKQVSKATKETEKESAALEAFRQAHSKAQADVQVLEIGLAELHASIEASEVTLSGLQDLLSTLQSQFFQAQSVHIGAKVKYETEVQHLRQYDQEIQALDQTKQCLSEALEQAAIDRKGLQATISGLIDSIGKADRLQQSLKAQHPWIKDTEQTFGLQGGPFDFGRENISECRKRLAAFEEQHSRLRKTINFNVMDMIDRIEAKETSLKQMLATVKKDRKMIEETIVTLDDYKMDALEKTYQRVNEDFGAIFAELLPGSFAKLGPLEGQSLTDGLEIRVRLGSVWKASLTELSGGQRSVIALALILALLQYKPAPMYILDEVDAALDLSHTQNIGGLLKSRFKGSQFIVVSLKEGMFENANVLFRTRFRDGVSSVERHQNPRPTSGKVDKAPKASKRAGINLPKAAKATTAALS